MPFKIEINFLIITILSHALIILLISKILKKTIFKYFCFFYFTSYLFFYYNTNPIRVDPLMLFFMTLFIFLLKNKSNLISILLCLIISISVHELSFAILIFILIDSKLGSNLFFIDKYSSNKLFIILFGGLIYLFYLRKSVLIEKSTLLTYNSNNIFLLTNFIIKYSGGILKHFLRKYASFGPALLFAFTYFICNFNKREIYSLLLILLIQIILTLLAADTLRVMEVSFFIIFLHSSRFILNIISLKSKILFLFAQIAFSSIVYTNLNNNFENNLYLNLISMIISILAFFLCLTYFFARKNYLPKDLKIFIL